VRRLVAACLLAGLAAAQEPPDDAAFERDLAFLLPKPGELEWQSIRWQPSLAAAVPVARAARKPILLWAMNGHPLACT
jgi:hypothetical protein